MQNFVVFQFTFDIEWKLSQLCFNENHGSWVNFPTLRLRLHDASSEVFPLQVEERKSLKMPRANVGEASESYTYLTQPEPKNHDFNIKNCGHSLS